MQLGNVHSLPTELRDALLELTDSDLLSLLRGGDVDFKSSLLREIVQKVKELSIFEHIHFDSKANDIAMTMQDMKGMNVKKVHEVREICPHIDSLWKENGVKTIVDIGAGQGYIDRVFLNCVFDYSFLHPIITTT